jgi:uncharacterized protein YkwD
VRTGLLGASAAMAMGAVAVTSGLLPGSSEFDIGGNESADRVRAADTPSDLETQGGEQTIPSQRSSTPAGRDAKRSKTPSGSPSPSRSKTATAPFDGKKERESSDGSSSGTAQKRTPAPSQSTATAPDSRPPRNRVSGSGSAETAAKAAVLALVNKERLKAGCSPVLPDTALAELAGNFSEDMAERGFFDHTDPDGDTPWSRAKQAGITNLGGENIARGQANAQSVMDAWMNSPGHRANILNCNYKTLGVGVQFGEGGPWWTQNFGF